MLILNRKKSTDEARTLQQQDTTESQLQETLNQLKRSNQTKDDLLTKMGHEMLTPMNGIMGSLELALYTYDWTQQNQLIKTALNSTHKLHCVIRDIIDLSQLNRGELKIKKSHFTFDHVLTDLLYSSQKEAEEKGLTWNQVLNLNKDLELNGDGERLTQVLRNIIGNAIKFTETGSITTRFNGTVKNRRLLLFEAIIEDTGIGIDKHEQPNIFKNFYQIEAFCNRVRQGSGVGLSLAYLLVKQMGGQISVQSKPGKGSRFTLTIPMTLTRAHEHNQHHIQWGNRSAQVRATQNTGQYDAKSTVKSSTACHAHASTHSRVQHSSQTPLKLEGHVLIVEDNGVNQMILKGLLNKIGLTSDVAANGKVALEKLDTHDYQLVLMDCQMPVMDGLTASRFIRKRSDAHHEVPIIAITANVTEKDRHACLDSGMNAVLNKPIQANTLYPVMIQWLNNPAPLSTQHTLAQPSACNKQAR